MISYEDATRTARSMTSRGSPQAYYHKWIRLKFSDHCPADVGCRCGLKYPPVKRQIRPRGL